jgi:hypothetical protein
MVTNIPIFSFTVFCGFFLQSFGNKFSDAGSFPRSKLHCKHCPLLTPPCHIQYLSGAEPSFFMDVLCTGTEGKGLIWRQPAEENRSEMNLAHIIGVIIDPPCE